MDEENSDRNREHASEEDKQDIMERSMEAKVAEITGEGTLISETEARINLISCGKCPGCEALENLVEGLGIGRVIDYRSGEAKELIALILQSFKFGKDEKALLETGHPLLIANGEVQFQFSRNPPEEEIFEEWYEFIYGERLEAV